MDTTMDDLDASEPLMDPMEITEDIGDAQPIVRELSPDIPMVDPQEAAMARLRQEEKAQLDSFVANDSYMWNIENIDRQPARVQSEVFECDGYYWQLMLCPMGNLREYRHHISAFLCVPDAEGAQAGLRRTTFKLRIVNKIDPDDKKYVKIATNEFEDRGSDWGFNQLALQSEIYNPKNGYLHDGGLKIEVSISVTPPDIHMDNLKRQIGFVGLKNQGATCYMNSLLQTLYNINIFRQAVYQMPIAEEEQAESSIPLALQSLFFKMQFGKHVVGTKSLTQSFGWTSLDAFTQHDVQELARILSDRLEQKMKGTVVEGTIARLFEFNVNNFVRCLNVDCGSTRQEVYADLQLLVKDCKTMYESFDKFVEVDLLNGRNQYDTDTAGHGHQDAEKGMQFDSFPPVLQIQLRRFEYDVALDQMAKLNSRYEFPEMLDLDIDDGKYLSENADRSVRNLFRLHSVLVHAGGTHGGHYYAFVNPSGNQWIKFDDDKVSLVSKEVAIDQNFGTDELTTGSYNRNVKNSNANAYMLVYIRESDWHNVMCEVGKEYLQPHVLNRLERELADKVRSQREKQELHLYTDIRIATDASMKEYLDSDNHFDLVDFDKAESFKVKKFCKFREFREQYAKHTGIPPERQVWWRWNKRDNGSYRPKEVYTDRDDDKFVCFLKTDDDNFRRKTWNVRLNVFFMEAPENVIDALYRSSLRSIGREAILLFWKRYLPREARLEYVGHNVFPSTAPIKQALPVLASGCSNLPLNLDYMMFEEVKSIEVLMITPIQTSSTTESEQLENGDIIILQEHISQEEARTLQYPDVRDYLGYVRDRIVVTFKQVDKPQEAGFELELSKEMIYEEVEAKVAEALVEDGVALPDSQCLRFTAQQAYQQAPKPSPIGYKAFKTLSAVFQYKISQGPDTLYYEILDIPLPEFEKLKVLELTWHNTKGEQVKAHKLRARKEDSVTSLLKMFCEQEPEAAKATSLRLIEANSTKICRVYPQESDETVANLADDSYTFLRVEAIAEDDLELEDGLDINCCHVSPSDNRRVSGIQMMPFGDPLIIRVGAEEPMSSVAERLQKRLEVKEEDFAKWQFRQLRGIMTTDSDLIQPDDIVAKRFGGSSTPRERMTPDYLGLQHAITHAKRAANRSYNSGAGIKIQ